VSHGSQSTLYETIAEKSTFVLDHAYAPESVAGSYSKRKRHILAAEGKLGFERQSIGEIEVWNVAEPSKRVIKLISEFQQILRRCNAVDEATIEMFAAMELNSRAVSVQNIACVLEALGI
jgi:predicted Mrr-cat superfamily restriction endonuclease